MIIFHCQLLPLSFVRIKLNLCQLVIISSVIEYVVESALVELICFEYTANLSRQSKPFNQISIRKQSQSVISRWIYIQLPRYKHNFDCERIFFNCQSKYSSHNQIGIRIADSDVNLSNSIDMNCWLKGNLFKIFIRLLLGCDEWVNLFTNTTMSVKMEMKKQWIYNTL